MPASSEQQPAKLAAVRTSEPFRKRRHWPKTLEARIALGLRELRAPATFEEYLALSDKLSDYKQIPSLQQVIFIEQEEAWASTYIRVGAKEWRNLDLTSPEDQIPILDQAISLQQVYASILDV